MSSRGARSRRVAIVTAVLAALAVSCAAPPPVPSSIAIGASLPLSGADAAVGAAIRRGYARAFAEANAAGGVPVRQGTARVRVGLEVRDDAGDPAMVEDKLRDLVRAGCQVLLATASDVRSAAQAALADQLARPYVVNAEDAPGLPGTRQKWVFMVRATGDREARAYQTARALLHALERAERFDGAGIRRALTRSASFEVSEHVARR